MTAPRTTGTLEVAPVGYGCNLACSYCYQGTVREGGGAATDVDAIMKTLEREGRPFTTFGGEPLLAPIATLERLWAFGLERYGKNTIQTNGALLDDRLAEMCERYKVLVGFSIDGPGELNEARQAHDPSKTAAATEASCANLARFLREKRPCSLIVTLSKANAAPDRIGRLVEWFRELRELGLESVCVHLLEVDGDDRLELSVNDLDAALLALDAADCAKEIPRVDIFTHVLALLRGRDSRTPCVWNACDPYTTESVRHVSATGELQNCGRTYKGNTSWVKSDAVGRERQLVLMRTPQADGGCHGCRFFVACKGYCPGTAIDGDWRNRSRNCETLKRLFARAERALVAVRELPVSLRPDLPQIEARMEREWRAGRAPRLAEIVHGQRGSNSGHVDTPHIDNGGTKRG